MVNYLGGNMPTFALNFSRPGGQIIAQYYNFLRLGMEGYRRVHQACYDTAHYLADEINKAWPFLYYLQWPWRYSGNELVPERRR